MAAIVLENHPTTPQADLARRRIVDANRRLWKGPENDLSGLEEASSILTYFIAEDPVAPSRIDSAQQLREVQEDLVQSEWSPPSGTFAPEIPSVRRMKSAAWPTGTPTPPVAKNQSLGHRKVRPLIPIPLRSLVDELP